MSPEVKERMDRSAELHGWAMKAYNRLYVSLLYAAGDITVDEAVKLGDHKDAAAFLKYHKNALESAQEFKARKLKP